MRPLLAAVLLLQLSFALPLKRVPVRTSVDGHAFQVYLTGKADIALEENGARVTTKLQIDFSELQEKFPSIVRARENGTSCEYRVTINGASLRRVDGRTEAAAIATGEVWRCENGVPQEKLATDTGRVRFEIGVQRTAEKWIAFTITPRAVEGPERLRNTVTEKLAGEFAEDVRRSLGTSFGAQTLTAPMPPDLQSLQPSVRSVQFVEDTAPQVVLEIDAELFVPSEKLQAILEWAGE